MQIRPQRCDIFDAQHVMPTLEKIEHIARVCHKSQDKTKAGGSIKFLQTLWDMGHGSVFEHVYVCVRENRILATMLQFGDPWPYGMANRILVKEDKCKDLPPDTLPVNGRDFLALGGTLEELAELPQAPASYYNTVCVYTDRGISHQLVRHRQLSFTQESTRNVNYTKPGNELVVIEPIELQDAPTDARAAWEFSCAASCAAYEKLIACGMKPQAARSVLPTALATKLYITGTTEQLQHMLKLRYVSKAAQPQVRALLAPLANHYSIMKEEENGTEKK